MSLGIILRLLETDMSTSPDNLYGILGIIIGNIDENRFEDASFIARGYLLILHLHGDTALDGGTSPSPGFHRSPSGDGYRLPRCDNRLPRGVISAIGAQEEKRTGERLPVFTESGFLTCRIPRTTDLL